jgi:hypothetical protein
MKKNADSPEELAKEALDALKKSPMTPEEHFEFLVKQGIIDRSGRVLVAKLFGANGTPVSSATSPQGNQTGKS